MRYHFIITRQDKNKRLDLFIVERIKRVSRNSIQKLIRCGNVFVNSRPTVKSGYSLRMSDNIIVNMERGVLTESDIQPVEMDLSIIYQDKNILVIDKPSGIAVYAGAGKPEKNLMQGLLFKFRKLRSFKRGKRFGLIHRIDKDTSGILLVALNEESLWYFSRQFEEREVEKYYMAVIKGDIRKLFGRKEMVQISNYIGRNLKDRKKFSVVAKGKGRAATTNIYFLSVIKDKNLDHLSLVLAEPKTGRTHQIRVHLASLGFPIVGDRIYSTVKYSRMLLHAFRLKIEMPDGRTKRFEARLPPEFTKLFNTRDFYHRIGSITKWERD